jgi:hypothetical protein
MRDKYVFVPNAAVARSHQSIRAGLEALFVADKARRKAAADAAARAVATSLAALRPRENAHGALHTYERAHLAAGGDWARLQAEIVARFGKTVTFSGGPPPVALNVDVTLQVTSNNFVQATVGEVRFGEDRFELLAAQPVGVAHPVFRRRDDTRATPRHYVHLPQSGTYAKRFVTRGLSAFDAMNMTRGLPLTSVIQTDRAQHGEVGHAKGNTLHPHRAGVVLNENEQILSHTRGWGGAKRYISTGVSERPAYSTRGTIFASMYGVVTVDLARVQPNTLFDLHRPDLASARLGVNLDAIDTTVAQPGHGYADQHYLAYRDTIRTRELLIKGTVPFNAMNGLGDGIVLLGIASLGGAHDAVKGIVAALPDRIRATIVDQDHMKFTDPASGRKWHCIHFSSAPARAAGQRALAGPLTAARTVVAFQRWQQVRPAGMI